MNIWVSVADSCPALNVHEVHELSRIKIHPLTLTHNHSPFSHPGSASEGEKG